MLEPTFLIAALCDPRVDLAELDGLGLFHPAHKAMCDAVAVRLPPVTDAVADNLPAVLRHAVRRVEPSADDEVTKLLLDKWTFFRMGGRDPIEFLSLYRGNWQTAAEVALEKFTINSGEASCERVFSAAGYFDQSRRSFAPATLTKLTMAKFCGSGKFSHPLLPREPAVADSAQHSAQRSTSVAAQQEQRRGIDDDE